MNGSESGRFPLVVVGCGRIVEIGHAPALKSSGDFEVTGLVDPSSKRRAAVRAALSANHLCEADSTLPMVPLEGSAVLLATPSHIRLSPANRVLDAGAAALLVEKPLGADGPSARQLMELAKEYSVPLVPVHNHRFEASFSEAVALARRGELGDIHGIAVTHHMNEPFAGAWPEERDWRVQLPLGCLGDLGYHALYLTAQLAPSGTTPLSCKVTWSDDEPATIDHAALRLRHKGGVESRIVCSWTADEPLHELRIEGTQGLAVARNDGTLTVTSFGGSFVRHTHAAGLLDMYTKWYQHAARRIHGETDDSEVRTAVAVSHLLDQLVASATRQPRAGGA